MNTMLTHGPAGAYTGLIDHDPGYIIPLAGAVFVAAVIIAALNRITLEEWR